MSLTEDDNHWFRGELASFLEQVAELREEVSGVRGEVAGVREELAGVRGKVSSLRSEFDAKLERVETSLLTEFHKWASPNEMRQRGHSASIRALELEMESLSDRVKKLEEGSHGSHPEQRSLRVIPGSSRAVAGSAFEPLPLRQKS